MRVTAMLPVFAIFAATGAVKADTWTVYPDGTGDFPTIQAAIDAASDGDVIELTDGTFTGNGNRDLSYLGKTITVRSQSGDPEACVIDCQATIGTDEHRAFVFESGEGAGSILEAITITGGRTSYPVDAAGGILITGGSSPTITRCVFTNNESPYGGAVEVDFQSSPVITDCTFRRNIGAVGGGAILIFVDSNPTVTDCTFLENTAGGGAGAVFISHTSNPIFTRCSFRRNVSGDWGGAVAVQQGSLSEFHDCEFVENTSMTGAAVYVRLSAIPSIYTSTFWGNTATNHGVIACDGGDAFFERSIVAFNPSGESFWCDGGGSATLECCDVFGNPDGDWVGCVASQQGVNGNLSADPLFCQERVGDFHLQAGSPCADDPVCGRIGALPAGCQPATASVSGVVTLNLESDHSGVQVEALPDTVKTFTSASGAYSLEALYPGSYTIRVSKEGWSAQEQEILLGPDAAVTDLDFVLTPLDQFEECQALNQAIPEGYAGFGTDIDVDVSGFTVPPRVSGMEVYVDVSHPHTGDLFFGVTHLETSSVAVLLQGSGGDDGSVTGWYPGDFDPVTSLDVFSGEMVEGPWRFWIFDLRSPETSGTLNSWCLRIHFFRDPVGVPSDEMPGVLVLRSGQPNPFVSETTLRFDLPSSQDVRLLVFDSLGRRVARLLSASLEAGPHQVNWQGRDDQGRLLPSGVYFYQLEAGDRALRQKIVVLR